MFICYALVVHMPYVASIKLQINSPSHGAVLDLAAGRANGGANLEVGVMIGAQERFVDGQTVSLYINGSRVSAISLAPARSLAPGFLIPAANWQPGRAWMHIELCIA